MKKLILAGLFLLAIGSFGGTISHVHAQTVTTNDQASLEQTLEVMKARLVSLEMQQGLVPQGDEGLAQALPATLPEMTTPSPVATGGTSTLSPDQVAAISTALDSLKTALTGLQTALANDPTLATTNRTEVLTALQGIGSTLASIGDTLGGSAASAPIAAQTGGTPKTPAVAQANPSTPAKTTPSPVAIGGQTAPSTPTTPSTPSTPAASAPSTGTKTAQASSIVTFTKAHWPTIAIVVLIIIALLVLFWPTNEEEMPSGRSPKQGGAPRSGANREHSGSNMPQGTGTMASAAAPQHATPVSTVVAAPAQKVDVQPAKVTVVRPQDPKRKTA